MCFFNLSADLVVKLRQLDPLRRPRGLKVHPPLPEKLAKGVQQSELRQLFLKPKECSHLVDFEKDAFGSYN